jgi:periplasmic protein CpxP/Spy
MEKTKLLTIAVIGLLLLNFGLLAFLWKGGGQGRPPEGGKNGQLKALNYLMDELKFDASQRSACGLLLQNHRYKMDSLQNINRQNRDRLYDNLKTGDSTAAFAMGTIQSQVELEAFSYFRHIRAVCNESQKEAFDRVIYEAMRMMKPPQPPESQKH